MITLEMFTKGFYILGFDLKTGRTADEEYIRLHFQANVRIEARNLHFVCWISWTRCNRQFWKRHCTISTTQIDKFLSKHLKYFQGVYTIDLFPSTLTKPSIIFINLYKHYMRGSNRVAVCISESGYAEYFDSYALPPYKLEIIAFLQCHSKSWKFNRHKMQGLSSKVCGHYCYIYVLHRAKRQSMTCIVEFVCTCLLHLQR